MSRKAWAIVIGLGLVWLSPLLFSLGMTAYKKHQKADYDRRAEAFRVKVAERLRVTITDEERARWKEQARLEKIREEAERDRKRNEYLASPIQVPMRPSSFPVDDDEDRPRTRTVYVYASDSGYQSRQPDLSGIYYNIPLTGPNNGNVQFNAIGGPY